VGGGSNTSATNQKLSAEEKISKGLKTNKWPTETPQK